MAAHDAVFVITASLAWYGRAASRSLLFSYIFPAVIILTYGRFYTEYGVVWTAAVLGAMAPAVRSGWAVPLPWRAPLILWALTVALSWPIVVLREFDFVWTTLDEPRLATSIGGGFPHLMAIGVANVAATIGIGILWFDWLFLTFALTCAGFGDGSRRRSPQAGSWLWRSPVISFSAISAFSAPASFFRWAGRPPRWATPMHSAWWRPFRARW